MKSTVKNQLSHMKNTMVTITDLPAEILFLIFQFYSETESQAKLIINISRVCRVWNKIVRNSGLWKKFDGTVSHKKMMELCKKGRLDHTRELIVSKTQCLKDDDGNELFSRLKNLEVLNLSQVEKFSKNTIPILASNCSELKEIIIGQQRKKPILLMHPELELFFTATGKSLTSIKLSYCKITNLTLNLRCISNCCPNLEELQLTNIYCTLGVFPTKWFQLQCPKLKTLFLDNNIRISNQNHSSGFPELEVFGYVNHTEYSITDKEFECIVFNSPNLKFLNLTNCNISPEVLCTLPACSVEYLYISKSKIINGNNVSNVFKKWCHSLKQVDVSYSNNVAINKAMLNLVTVPTDSQLEFLDLNFTKITASVVKKVLQNCEQLEILHLRGCRYLGRGMKQTYSGKTEFKILFDKLQVLMSGNPDEDIPIT